MSFLRPLFFVILSFMYVECLGQLSITYPLNRCIFQRDKNNNAEVYIAGNFSERIDKIEVQFRPVNGGLPSSWMTLQDHPAGGYYRGSVNWSGGWYEMEVRGRRGDMIVGSATLPRVGIGEVFLVAGQSNAQGFFGYDAPGATDDRVNCVNYYSQNDVNSSLPYPQFSQVFDNTFISPRGHSAWAWGKLGDILAQRLNVPVLFYNVAWTGSAVRNWKDSIHGVAYSVYNGEPYVPFGMPYGGLRATMQNYVSMTGLRAVLWLQGEAEKASSGAWNYYEELKDVISQSRGESGKNFSWVVCRTSYYEGVNPPVIEAQNRIIADLPNVFAGPETDELQPRGDGLHFSGQGLSDLAEEWNRSLNDVFFALSEPFSAIPLPAVNVTCAGNNMVRLSLEGEYSSLNWSNGSSDRALSVGEGRYKATIRDQWGNVIYSPEIQIGGVIQPEKPSVATPDGQRLCQGSSISLQTSSGLHPVWSNGQGGDRITVTAAGQYSVKVTSIYGCEAVSDIINIDASPTAPPPPPTLTVMGGTTFCDGGEVLLRASSGNNSVWSDQSRSGELIVHTGGIYSARAVDDFGCYSVASEQVRVIVHALPQKPTIQRSGNTEFCEGGNVTLSSSYDQGNVWSNANTERAITVSDNGVFSVRVRDANGCESLSDEVSVRVNPLPQSPVITSLRPTTFCDRDYTLLQSDVRGNYRWNDGRNSREVEVRTSGLFSVTTTDQAGCTSLPSVPVSVVVNPLPERPVVTASGPLTFCEDKDVTLQSTPAQSYAWSNGSEERAITLNQEGIYHLTVKNEFGCISDPSEVVNTRVLPIPVTPSVVALGGTLFCDGGVVRLEARGGGPFVWSTGEAAGFIEASVSGSYFVQTLGDNGCLSLKAEPVEVRSVEIPRVPVLSRQGVFTLRAESNSGTFQWEYGSAVLSDKGALLKVTQSGNYRAKAYRVYDEQLTCFSDYSGVFVFSLRDEEKSVVVYPNPSGGNEVYMEVKDDLNPVSVILADAHGRTLKIYYPVSFRERLKLDTSFLSGGVYHLVVSDASGILHTRKLVIQK